MMKSNTNHALAFAPISIRSGRVKPSEVIAHHSKSFSLAAKLLPKSIRQDVHVLYTWCRYVDDIIDESDPLEVTHRLKNLEKELDSVYEQQPQDNPLLVHFQNLITKYDIPKHYPRQLLRGMRMDASQTSYEKTNTLWLYCYRVAGVVGLMMCHIMGVKRKTALANAAYLGMAMQLTNICRDVEEDWKRGRRYIPNTLLNNAAHLPTPQDEKTLPPIHRHSFSVALRTLLRHASELYKRGQAGTHLLGLRCAFAVLLAKHVYSDIGNEIRKMNYDVTKGRAFVPTYKKVFWVFVSACHALTSIPSRILRKKTFTKLNQNDVLHFEALLPYLDKASS